MTISMYQVSVPVFARGLGALAGVLTKAEALPKPRSSTRRCCSARGSIPTCSLNVQVGQVCTRATRGVAQLAGLTQPDFGQPETTIAALKERVTKALDFVKTATPAQIDGTEDKDIVLKFGTREMPFKGQAFLVGFTLPNFYFHSTTAYNILRSIGLEVGKRDFMGAP